MRSLVALLLGGFVLEAGFLWILVWSPQLTAIYTPEFTRELLSRLPWLLPSLGTERLDTPTMVSVLELGLVTTITGYALGLLGVNHIARRGSGYIILGFALIFRLTLVCLPGLFSTDVFSYVMAGRIAAIHAGNPYVQVPADFPADPFLTWVFPFWRDAPTIYGPAWADLSWILSKLTGEWANFDQVLVYRLSLSAMDLLTLWLVWRLLGWTLAGDGALQARRMAFCVFAWNPLLLFDLVGNTHNDVAMVLLMLVAVFFTTKEQAIPGFAAMTLSALVKYTTGIAVLLWITAWVARVNTTYERLARLALASATVLVITLLVATPWLTAPGALASLGQAANGRLMINSAVDQVALTAADQLLVPLGVDPDSAEATARFWLHLLTRGIFALYLGWEISRVWRNPRADNLASLLATLRAATRALLVLPFLVLNAVWSWYFSWPLALAVLLGWASWLTRLVVLYTLIGLPIVYAYQYLNQALSGAFTLVFAVGPLIAWACWFRLSRCWRQPNVGAAG